MKNLLSVLLLFASLIASAQQGIIQGKVTDAASGDEIIGANIVIQGTSTGASTNITGDYQFQAEPGTYTIVSSYIGYKPYKKEGVVVKAGETTLLNITIAEDIEALTEVVVEAKADRASENVLLMERKNASMLLQSIGAKELSKVAASDAAEGLQKVVGLSVQGNKYIVVRGMGDRYNTATLNGFPVASPDPDKRVLPFDIFPSNVVQSLDVVKAFSPELYGDFSGASINVVTQDYPLDPTLTISMGLGLNTQATFQEFMMDAERKNDVLGYNQTRDMPAAIDASKSFSSNESTELTNANTFSTSFNPQFFKAPLNQSYGITYGNFFGNSGRGLGILASANFSDGYAYQYGKVQTLRSDGSELIDFDFDQYSYSTTKSTLVNLAYRFGNDNVIRLYNTYSHLSEDVGQDVGGFHWDYSGSRGDILSRRLYYRSNSLLANQLVGDHGINSRLRVQWGGSYSKANSEEPDRRQLTYFDKGDGRYTFNVVDRREQHRFFYELEDADYSAKAGASYVLRPGADADSESLMEVSAGVQGRYKTRDFSSRIFTYYTNDIAAATQYIDINNPDQYFTPDNLSAGNFEISEQTTVADTYDATLNVVAPYANFKWQLVPSRLQAQIGLRAEVSEQEINYKLTTDSEYTPIRNTTIKGFDPLPALGLKYTLADDKTVRLNVSRTISRPDFKEIAPFQYTALAYGFTEQGNPTLENGFNYNLDVRYERISTRGSLFAVGAFGKYLDQPISRVILTGAVLLQTYANAEQATLGGVEVEYRQPLTFLGTSPLFEDLSIAANASLLYSNMTLGKLGGISSNQTSNEFALIGASPYLLNTDLSYNKERDNLGVNATVSYNIYGRRLYSLGSQGAGNIFEMPVHMLNVSTDFTFGAKQRWGISLEAKNLLNPLVRFEQEILENPNSGAYEVAETKDINSFRRGISIGMKFKYNLLAN